MVLDPHLAKHLSHWGINMMQVGRGQGLNQSRAAMPGPGERLLPSNV